MPDLRYLAIDRLTYARALVELVRLSRDHQGDPYQFGPLNLRQLEQAGLEVHGAGDLSPVLDRLSQVHGLVLLPDLEL
jgi:hypothetical protein